MSKPEPTEFINDRYAAMEQRLKVRPVRLANSFECRKGVHATTLLREAKGRDPPLLA